MQQQRNILEQARGLVQPGALFDPHQQRAIAAAAEAIKARGGPTDDTERRIVTVDERLTIHYPKREEKAVPPSLLQALAAAKAAHLPFVEAREQAKDAWMAATERYHRTEEQADGETANERERIWKELELMAKPTGRRVQNVERAIARATA
jgi:hypothetical protein